MKYFILFISVILFVGCGNKKQEDLVEFEFDISPSTEKEYKRISGCGFDDLGIPENTLVYAAGAYSGRKTDFQIDHSGHTATQFDIAVNSKSNPVILMLGAYEPTVWNVGWSKGTEIIAVMVSGYHRQALAGLATGIPVSNSSNHNKGSCGYFYVKTRRQSALNSRSKNLFGKDIESVYLGDSSGKIVIGDPISQREELVTSISTSPKSFVDPNATLAGKAGLENAVAKGLIRPATKSDAVRWVKMVDLSNGDKGISPPIGASSKRKAPSKYIEDKHVPPTIDASSMRRVPYTYSEDKGVAPPINASSKPRMPSTYNAYVVLKEFTFPAGLYGGNSAVFFIEKGVSFPKGNSGHSKIYDFNRIKCSGAICQR